MSHLITKQTNYKRWAYRLLLYLIVLKGVGVYLVTYYTIGEHNSETFFRGLDIINVLSTVFLAVGLVLTTLSIIHKEKRNYQFYAAVIGFSIFLILNLYALYLYL